MFKTIGWTAFQFIKLLFVTQKMRIQNISLLSFSLLSYLSEICVFKTNRAAFAIQKKYVQTSGRLLFSLLIINKCYALKKLLLQIL